MGKSLNNKITIILISLICIIFLSSCTSGIEEPLEEIPKVPESSEKEEVEEKDLIAQPGGNISLSILGPSHLNPIINQEEDGYHLLKLIFQPLISLDEEYKPKGVLAESWEIENDGKTIIFNLRKDVLWQDEKSFTAKDVIFTINAIKNKGVDSPYSPYVENIKNYKAIDDLKLEINFTNSQGGNLENFIFPIIPSHRYKNIKDVSTAYKWSPIGTGPYKLSKHNPGREITLKVNKNYWSNPPYIEKINGKIMSKKDRILKSFENKDSDLIKISGRELDFFYEDGNISIYPYIEQRFNFIGINHNNQLLKDRDIRKAIQLAINREEMLEEFYFGQGEVSDIPLATNSWLYDKGVKPCNFDMGQAKKIISDSKWGQHLKDDKESDESNNKKSKEKDKLEFDLIVNANNSTRKKEAAKIKGYLKEIGLKVNIKELSPDKFNKAIEKKNFDAILIGWDLSFVPDLSFAFHSDEIKKGMNFISFNNKDIDKLLVKGRIVENQEERKDVYSDLQLELSKELPYINLYSTKSYLLVNNRIKGPVMPTDYNLFNNIEEWFIEYKK